MEKHEIFLAFYFAWIWIVSIFATFGVVLDGHNWWIYFHILLAPLYVVLIYSYGVLAWHYGKKLALPFSKEDKNV